MCFRFLYSYLFAIIVCFLLFNYSLNQEEFEDDDNKSIESEDTEKSDKFDNNLITFDKLPSYITLTTENPFNYANTEGTQIIILAQKEVYSVLSIDNNNTTSFNAGLIVYTTNSIEEILNMSESNGLYFAFGLGDTFNSSHIFLFGTNKNTTNNNLEGWCNRYVGRNTSDYELIDDLDCKFYVGISDWGDHKTLLIWQFEFEEVDPIYMINGNQPLLGMYGKLDNNNNPSNYNNIFDVKSGDASKGNSTIIDNKFLNLTEKTNNSKLYKTFLIISALVYSILFT